MMIIPNLTVMIIPNLTMMIVLTLIMMIITSSDTARHSATSGSLDLSIHTTEVQVVFLNSLMQSIEGRLEAI